MARVKNQPVVKLKGMSGSEFVGKLNGLKKYQKARDYSGLNLESDLMCNLDVNLFAGMLDQSTSAADDAAKRMLVSAEMPVNLHTMCNLDPVILEAAGVPKSKTGPMYDAHCGYEGNTVNAVTYLEDGSSLPATPVGMDVVYDPAANKQNPIDNYTVTPHIDFNALGAASTRERNARRAEPLSEARSNRVDVTASMPVTQSGLGGMNSERVAQNAALCYAADYVMNASPKNPSERLASKDDIQAVAELYSKTYSDFVTEIKDKGCAGVPQPKKNGELATDRSGKVISCPSLKDMGLKAVDAGGAKVLVVAGDGKGKQDSKEGRRDGLKAMNEVFNARWKQVINERQADDPNAYKYNENMVRVGNAMSLNSHAVTVRNPMNRDQKTSLVIVQPKLDYEMSPKANALGKSIAVATHQLETKDREPYAHDIIVNAQNIATAFDTKTPGVEKTAEQKAADQKAAIQANMDQFNAICKAAKLDPAVAIKEPAQDKQAEGDMEYEG